MGVNVREKKKKEKPVHVPIKKNKKFSTSKRKAKKMGLLIESEKEVIIFSEEKRPYTLITKNIIEQDFVRGTEYYVSLGKFDNEVIFGIARLSEKSIDREWRLFFNKLNPNHEFLNKSLNGHKMKYLQNGIRIMNQFEDKIKSLTLLESVTIPYSKFDYNTLDFPLREPISNYYKEGTIKKRVITKSKYNFEELTYESALKKLYEIGKSLDILNLEKMITGTSLGEHLERNKREKVKVQKIEPPPKTLVKGEPVLVQLPDGDIILGDYISGTPDKKEINDFHLSNAIRVTRSSSSNGHFFEYKNVKFYSGGEDSTHYIFHKKNIIIPQKSILLSYGDNTLDSLYELQSQSIHSKNLLPFIEMLGGDPQYLLEKKIDFDYLYAINPQLDKEKKGSYHSENKIIISAIRESKNIADFLKVHKEDPEYPSEFELPKEPISVAEYNRLKNAYDKEKKKKEETFVEIEGGNVTIEGYNPNATIFVRKSELDKK
jgi:hypothetical protein